MKPMYKRQWGKGTWVGDRCQQDASGGRAPSRLGPVPQDVRDRGRAACGVVQGPRPRGLLLLDSILELDRAKKQPEGTHCVGMESHSIPCGALLYSSCHATGRRLLILVYAARGADAP
jgi:hypothetical protein